MGGSGWRLRGFVFHLFSFVVSKAGSLAQPGGNTQPALGTARSPRPLLPPRAETPGWSWTAGPRGFICPACLASSHPSCACSQCPPSPCPGAPTSLPPLKCPPPTARFRSGRSWGLHVFRIMQPGNVLFLPRSAFDPKEGEDFSIVSIAFSLEAVVSKSSLTGRTGSAVYNPHPTAPTLAAGLRHTQLTGDTAGPGQRVEATDWATAGRPIRVPEPCSCSGTGPFILS